MSDFLDNELLGRAIKDLMKGREVKCAVAFWGKGAVDAILAEDSARRGARVVCDVSMGGTNPEELEALGAPDNENLKHIIGLHAKVYLSDAGLITSSANASNNGIGFLDLPAGLIEAGAFHAAGSQAHQSAEKWFEGLWSRAKTVDAAALDQARKAWARQRRKSSKLLRPNPTTADSKSLLETVAADPEKFRGFGVVFTRSGATREELDETVSAVGEQKTLTRKQREELRDWKVGDLFNNWTRKDIGAWPRWFVCAHQASRGGIGYWFYERAHDIVLDGERGMVLGRRGSGVRRSLGFSYGAQEMAGADAKRLAGIFAHIGDRGLLCENSDKLQELLDAVA